MSAETAIYFVPTPIGNLGDMTYRAVDVLKAVDTILAEDTRNSGVLLKHYAISTPMQSFHSYNEHHRIEKVIEEAKEGKIFALISDAGSPGISDPGFLLARLAVQEGVLIESLPGATAFVPALVKSGFPTDRFVYEGFLPHKKGRKTRLEIIRDEKRTVVLYESPHRMIKLLEQIETIIGNDRLVSVSRELTKKFEQTVSGSVKEVRAHFEIHPPKGEFVVVIAGSQ
ncbi:MAG: 16S rRNA (cytidine1402-2'-O)-methyltransferase [Cyclobacteriaceae bacterium]|jgi:16S rRNA (cytidine1402-2'-O)-methyltransferase